MLPELIRQAGEVVQVAAYVVVVGLVGLAALGCWALARAAGQEVPTPEREEEEKESAA